MKTDATTRPAFGASSNNNIEPSPAPQQGTTNNVPALAFAGASVPVCNSNQAVADDVEDEVVIGYSVAIISCAISLALGFGLGYGT